jgi:hypothetical protein
MAAGLKAALLADARSYGLAPGVVGSIAVAPVALVVLFLTILRLPATRSAARWLLRENHPVELVQFLAFVGAAAIAGVIAWQARRRRRSRLTVGFYVAAGAAVLFVAMGEVSWGQWLIGFKPPARAWWRCWNCSSRSPHCCTCR